MIGKMIHGLETIREHFFAQGLQENVEKVLWKESSGARGKNTGKMRIGSSISTVVQQ